jgi:hypothetical protein
VAFWIVLGVGNEGTLAWYVGSGAVADRVFVVDDAAVVESVAVQRAEALADITRLEGELDDLAQAWRQARKQGDQARDTARSAYDTKLAEVGELKSAKSITTLVNAETDRPWAGQLQQFYADQNQWQLERVNRRRQSLDLEPKSAQDISVDFAGIVADSKIYIYHPDIANLKFPVQLLVCIAVVTLTWVITTYVTPATDKQTLRSFYQRCHPGGPGWRKVVLEARAEGEEIDQRNAIGDWKLPMQILCVFLGSIAIYASLFAVGNFVYGNTIWGVILIALACAALFALFRCFGKIGVESGE